MEAMLGGVLSILVLLVTMARIGFISASSMATGNQAPLGMNLAAAPRFAHRPRNLNVNDNGRFVPDLMVREPSAVDQSMLALYIVSRQYAQSPPAGPRILTINSTAQSDRLDILLPDGGGQPTNQTVRSPLGMNLAPPPCFTHRSEPSPGNLNLNDSGGFLPDLIVREPSAVDQSLLASYLISRQYAKSFAGPRIVAVNSTAQLDRVDILLLDSGAQSTNQTTTPLGMNLTAPPLFTRHLMSVPNGSVSEPSPGNRR